MAVKVRSGAIEKIVLENLRKFARNEFRFGLATTEELSELFRAIDIFFTEKQQSNIRIENSSIKDFRDEINEEFKFRKASLSELTPKEQLKLASRRLKDSRRDEDGKTVTVVRKLHNTVIDVLNKINPVAIKFRKIEDKGGDSKILDELRNIPSNPVKAIQRGFNKLIFRKQSVRRAAFSNWVKVNFKSLVKKKLITVGAFGIPASIQKNRTKVENLFFDDTGISL